MQVRVSAEVMRRGVLVSPLVPSRATLASLVPKFIPRANVLTCHLIPSFDPIRSNVHRLHDTDVSMGKGSLTITEVEPPLADKLFVETHPANLI